MIERNVNQLPRNMMRLWQAVINEAISDIINPFYSSDALKNRADAIAWLYEEDFNLVCQLAGYNPKEIRFFIRKIVAKNNKNNENCLCKKNRNNNKNFKQFFIKQNKTA